MNREFVGFSDTSFKVGTRFRGHDKDTASKGQGDSSEMRRQELIVGNPLRQRDMLTASVAVMVGCGVAEREIARAGQQNNLFAVFHSRAGIIIQELKNKAFTMGVNPRGPAARQVKNQNIPGEDTPPEPLETVYGINHPAQESGPALLKFQPYPVLRKDRSLRDPPHGTAVGTGDMNAGFREDIPARHTSRKG